MAREVSTDATDSMVTITKIIEKFNVGISALDFKKLDEVSQPIVLPISYSIATSWLFDEKLKQETFFNFKITIFDPYEKNLGGPEQENLLPAGIDKANMNFNNQGLPLTKAGKYKVVAELSSKSGNLISTAEYPFEIDIDSTQK